MDMEIDTESSAEVRVESDGGDGEESRKRILISNPLKDPYVSCFMRF
jgi:hypothetical protein